MRIVRTYSKNGLHLTESFERCRLVAYPDQGGVWTIGWGHTKDVHEGMTCTQAQADTWLQLDIAYSAMVVNRLVTVDITQDEFDSMVDFVFNCGPSNFAHSTLLRLLNQGCYQAAANEFDKWDHVAGKQCQGLLRRRQIETTLFNTPDSPTENGNQTS